MADISLTIAGTCTVNGVATAVNDSFTDTLNGTGAYSVPQTIPITVEAIALGDTIAFPAWVILQNNDATNYVEVDFVTPLVNKMKIKPASFIGPILINASVTIYAQANTAPCVLQVSIFPI